MCCFICVCSFFVCVALFVFVACFVCVALFVFVACFVCVALFVFVKCFVVVASFVFVGCFPVEKNAFPGLGFFGNLLKLNHIKFNFPY